MNILIVGPSWVGDMVMAQSLFKHLKVRYPTSKLDVVVPSWSLPIIARMPEINHAIELSIRHGELDIVKRYQIGKELRGQYDQAIVLPRSFKAALLPCFARIPRRTGYKGEMRYGLINDIHKLDKKLLTQTVQRYVALGLGNTSAVPDEMLFPELSINKKNQEKLIKKFALQISNLVAFMPGAEYGPAKCWPLKYFRDLALSLIEKNKQVIILGSAKEKLMGQGISQNHEKIINLCGETSLEDVVDLLALSQHAVTNDSGLMHVACAVGSKVIAIYGSSSPLYTPPLSESAEVIQHKMDCSPCFARECRYGHFDCLKKVSVSQVLEKIL